MPVNPPPTIFVGQDLNREEANITDLVSYPKSDSARNAFLLNFNVLNASLEESFETYLDGFSGPFLFDTIGTVSIEGDVLGVINLPEISTHGNSAFLFALSVPLEIVVPPSVVGVGFSLTDLGDSLFSPPYIIQVLRGSIVVDTLTIPFDTSSTANLNVIYIGYINYNGFDKIVLPGTGVGYDPVSGIPFADIVTMDQLHIFKDSEILRR
jgi:hypothetical protein